MLPVCSNTTAGIGNSSWHSLAYTRYGRGRWGYILIGYQKPPSGVGFGWFCLTAQNSGWWKKTVGPHVFSTSLKVGGVHLGSHQLVRGWWRAVQFSEGDAGSRGISLCSPSCSKRNKNNLRPIIISRKDTVSRNWGIEDFTSWRKSSVMSF